MGVYKRGSVYYMDFLYKGMRTHKSTECTRKEDALKVEKQAREALKGEPEKPNSPKCFPTLSEAAVRIFGERWHRGSYGVQAFNNIMYIADNFGNPRLNLINKAFVNRVKQELLKTRSVATCNRYISSLRAVLNTAKEEWELDLVVPRFRLEKESKGREVIIDASLEKTLLRYFAEVKLKRGQEFYRDMPDLLIVLLDTGLRISEALNGSYGVHYNMETKMVCMFAKQTKGDTDRIIPMSKRVYDVLKKRQATHFPKPFPFTRFQASDAFRAAKDMLSITDEDLCIHSTRHTFASRLLNGGADLRTVQLLLGHSSIVTTTRYSHLAVPKLQEAIAKLK